MFQKPELKIKDEFDGLLLDGDDCTPINVPFLFKKYNRDSYGNRVKCPACNSGKNGNKEGSLDCPYCLGAGYTWKHGIGTGWLGKPEFSIERTLVASIADRMADSAFTKLYLYTNRDLVFKDTDVILVPRLKEGKIEIPVVSEGIFSIFDEYNFRSDQSQSEYNRYRLNTTLDSSFKSLIEV